MAQVGFCSVDGNVDQEEGARGVRVWKSGLVRSEVEVVSCGGWEDGCFGELEGQNCISCYFVRNSLHFDGSGMVAGRVTGEVSWDEK